MALLALGLLIIKDGAPMCSTGRIEVSELL